MRQWASPIAGWYGVFLAAVLLPGGLLLLAWALYRGRRRQASRVTAAAAAFSRHSIICKRSVTPP